jgi:glycerol-3-phosphate dehydrogenase
MFAIPYQEGKLTLIGTTDEPYTADKDKVEISDTEIEYLVKCANEYFEDQITRDDIVSTYSGVRPLYDDQSENASKVTRDYVLSYEDFNGAGILSIFGGKITTYRTLAENVMDVLKTNFPNLPDKWTKEKPLPGGDIPHADFDAFYQSKLGQYSWLADDVVKRMCRAYGTKIDTLLSGASSLGDLGSGFGNGLYEKELEYLIQHEFVTQLEDVLWRRSKLGLRMTNTQIDDLKNWFESKAA